MFRAILLSKNSMKFFFVDKAVALNISLSLFHIPHIYLLSNISHETNQVHFTFICFLGILVIVRLVCAKINVGIDKAKKKTAVLHFVVMHKLFFHTHSPIINK